MISLFISLAVLLIGFFAYGKITEKVFAPDNRQTPAVAINDGVDHVPMKTWKASSEDRRQVVHGCRQLVS